METPNLTFAQQKKFFAQFFPNFRSYFEPFNLEELGLSRAVVETFGKGDHLLLLMHQEMYRQTASRFTTETINRKLNIPEVVKHFYPTATEEEVNAIIYEFILKGEPTKNSVWDILGGQPSSLDFTPETKPEEVPDDKLGEFGRYKNYAPLWAMHYLSGRRQKRLNKI